MRRGGACDIIFYAAEGIAAVLKLVDRHASGACVGNNIEVQVLSAAL